MGLKIKKDVPITIAFQKFLTKSNCRPNKKWADTGSEFYSRSMKSWLQHNHTEMYSANKEGQSFVAQRFIRNLIISLLNLLDLFIKMCILIN